MKRIISLYSSCLPVHLASPVYHQRVVSRPPCGPPGAPTTGSPWRAACDPFSPEHGQMVGTLRSHVADTKHTWEVPFIFTTSGQKGLLAGDNSRLSLAKRLSIFLRLITFLALDTLDKNPYFTRMIMTEVFLRSTVIYISRALYLWKR